MGRKKGNCRRNSKPATNVAVDPCSASEKSGQFANISVSDRFSFPFVRDPRQDFHPDFEDDSEIVEFDFRPRKVYLPNVCVECSQLCRDEVLCPKCKLVSYCSEDHLGRDRRFHEDFCRSLTELRRELERSPGSRPPESGDEYRMRRITSLGRIEKTVGRCLELWEREVVLYPRACVTCHGTPLDLQCCPDCRVVFWCQGQGHDADHSEWCVEYRIFRLIVEAQVRHGHVVPWIPSVTTSTPKPLEDNFSKVMSKLYKNSEYFKNMDVYTYATLSHVASVPLTALYALQSSRKDWSTLQVCRIHVVGAEFHYEGMNLDLWEKLFSHFLPNLKNLLVTIIGPELRLPDVPEEMLARVTPCTACRQIGRKVHVSFAPEILYHEFCDTSAYRQPDLVCLFNPGLYRATGFAGRDTWSKTIQRVCEPRSPILVTAYTEFEIPKDVRRIEDFCGIRIILEPRRNPFSSLKPDRNFVSDDVVPLIYKNYFLSVVQPLPS